MRVWILKQNLRYMLTIYVVPCFWQIVSKMRSLIRKHFTNLLIWILCWGLLTVVSFNLKISSMCYRPLLRKRTKYKKNRMKKNYKLVHNPSEKEFFNHQSFYCWICTNHAFFLLLYVKIYERTWMSSGWSLRVDKRRARTWM